MEVLGLAVLALGIWVLSRSDLITGHSTARQLPISYDHFAARFVRFISM